MTFLPIVDRELRVAARKRSTFWVRVAAAMVALVIAVGFLLMTEISFFRSGPASLGRGLFAVLTWLSLAAALSAGLFFTSDCLSEEKREGTLGFLFLTDLRGYDVVLGKLMVTSLRCVYALLAVLPIIGITILMGGVSGEEFWKTALALMNALFFSLAAGLFVSAISRDSQKALAATVVVLIALLAAGPVGDWILVGFSGTSFNPILSVSSPVYLFMSASRWSSTLFWESLAVNQLIAWLLLSLACLLLPRTWQDRGTQTVTVKGRWAHAWKFGTLKRRTKLRQKLLSVNPVLWLACRERWQAVSFWIVTILLVTGLLALFAIRDTAVWIAWSSLGGIFTLLWYLGVASQVGRLFVDAQRSGLIELLLVTPLTVAQMVQGQWRGLLRMFGAPLVLWLVAQQAGTIMAQRVTWSRFAAAVPPGPAAIATNANTTNTIIITNSVVRTSTTVVGSPAFSVSMAGFVAQNNLLTLAISLTGTLTMLANLVALTWFGMWMGLNSKTTNLATLKTIVFVQIIPWFAVDRKSTRLNSSH